jgi:cell wall-associated NlpC family hydrolase
VTPVAPAVADAGLLAVPAPAASRRVNSLIPGIAELQAQWQGSTLVQQVRGQASDLVESAMNFIGVRYRRGGTSAETGFDCSGFTRHVFEATLGRVLPRRADQQARDGELQNVRRDELRPGDLVFFNTMKRAFSHVGIYIGEGKFIHAPRTGGEVRIEDMRQAYWSRRFDGGRRDLALGETPRATDGVAAARLAAPALGDHRALTDWARQLESLTGGDAQRP